MDPAIVDLTARVMAVLMPFVAKGAEEFASKVGDATYEKAKMLLTTLRQKWLGDTEATKILDHFEEKPERYRTVLEDILQEKLLEDKDLAPRLTQLLQGMGPTLEIIQKVEEGKDIKALKAKEMRRGEAKITQDMKKVEGVTGAEFDTLG